MLLAPACRCIGGPRVFERGWCHRCGRLLDPVIDTGEVLDGWLRLEAAIERERIVIRERAESAGVSTFEFIAGAWG